MHMHTNYIFGALKVIVTFLSLFVTKTKRYYSILGLLYMCTTLATIVTASPRTIYVQLFTINCSEHKAEFSPKNHDH